MGTKKKTKLGQALIQSLQEANDWKLGKIDLQTKDLELPDDPPEYSSKMVKAVRDQLKLSQPVLAKYLGVTDKAVKSWEQGASRPSGSAARLLQLATSEPKTFRSLILKSSKRA